MPADPSGTAQPADRSEPGAVEPGDLIGSATVERPEPAASGPGVAAGRPALAPAIELAAAGAALLALVLAPAVGCPALLGLAAVVAARRGAWWLAGCAAAWILVLLAVLTVPGPYDSWAGRAAVPVLTGYALVFLAGWAGGRMVAGRRAPPAGRPVLSWPTEWRLRGYLAGLLVLAVLSAALRYRHGVPPLLAPNPDAARAELSTRDGVLVGLLAEAWTLGMLTCLLRALVGPRSGRWWYLAGAVVFIAGAALGASKNSVLVGVLPAVVAALSVRAPARPGGTRSPARTRLVVLVGLVAVAGAVYLGGQRTLAGTGAFEDQFRARYGGNPVLASVGSLDLSLSSSAETFGRLWSQRDAVPRAHGGYALEFLGRHERLITHRTDLYAITAQFSAPYYMNTATFVAVPLLDWGPVGAAGFLLLLGVGVGWAERRLAGATGPAGQLGRGLIVYFAVFGVYELYPAFYATWLALGPGLWLLYRLGRGHPGSADRQLR